MPNAAELLAILEKSALAGDPSARQVLEHPITGILLKELVESPVPAYIRFDIPASSLILKDGKRRIIHGYASVEVIDKQNELVTIPALQKAWDRMQAAGEKYANINLEHSNITIGKILLKGTVEDAAGNKYWSHVDDKGLYVVAELRDDIEIADKVWEMANKGELNAFSIGGRALGGKSLAKEGGTPFWKINDLELYEITVCKRGKNTESGFQVLKSYLEHGLISEEMFLQKSAELSKSEKLVKELSFLPNLMGKSLIIRKDFICQVGSSVEKGEGRDFDLLVKMDTDNPMRRHVETRILKALPPELWDKLEFVFGDEGGPHDTFRPLFDLALVPCDNLGKVEMVKGEPTVPSAAQSDVQSNGTLKNIDDRTDLTEDKKMSEKVNKTIGTPELTGTGTGPTTGGVTGTSATGPDIARIRGKIKELEAMLPSAGKEGAVKAELKPGEEEKPEKEAAKPEEDEDAKEAAGKDKTKLPYPDEDEKMLNDPEVIAALDGLEAKGKVPPGLKRYIEEHRKKSDSQRITKMEQQLANIASEIATLSKSIGSINVDTIAKSTAAILKNQSQTIKKSAFTGDNKPETPGALDTPTGQPLTLQSLHDMPWGKVHDMNDQRTRERA